MKQNKLEKRKKYFIKKCLLKKPEGYKEQKGIFGS